MNGVEALIAILSQARAFTTRAQVVDLVGKIASKLGVDRATTITEVGGPIYELLTVIKVADKGYTPVEPAGVGDNVYDRTGHADPGPQRVRQQKWVTGSGRGTRKTNATSALDQLAGLVQGNPERAPDGSVAIVDLVFTAPHANVQNLMAGDGQNFANWANDLMTADRRAQLTDKGTTVKLRVTTINGAAGTSTKRTVDISNGRVDVRAPETRERDDLVVAQLLIQQLAEDVQAHGRDAVKHAIQAFGNQLT